MASVKARSDVWQIDLKYIFSVFLLSSGYEANSTVFYGLIHHDTFYINRRTFEGQRYADVKVHDPLDFEMIKEYNLTICAEVCLVDHTLL